jgi:hypothetical protein
MKVFLGLMSLFAAGVSFCVLALLFLGMSMSSPHPSRLPGSWGVIVALSAEFLFLSLILFTFVVAGAYLLTSARVAAAVAAALLLLFALVIASMKHGVL